jgi:hypothetical protein
MNPVAKEDLVYLYTCIDRDFASIEEQNKADQIVDSIAIHFFGKTIRGIESEIASELKSK